MEWRVYSFTGQDGQSVEMFVNGRAMGDDGCLVGLAIYTAGLCHAVAYSTSKFEKENANCSGISVSLTKVKKNNAKRKYGSIQ
jgi:hypothetical protein